MYVCMYVCLSYSTLEYEEHMHTYTYAYMLTYMYAYMHTYMYAYMHVNDAYGYTNIRSIHAHKHTNMLTDIL